MIEIKITCDHCGGQIKKEIEEAYVKLSVGEFAHGAQLCDACQLKLCKMIKTFCNTARYIRGDEK